MVARWEVGSKGVARPDLSELVNGTSVGRGREFVLGHRAALWRANYFRLLPHRLRKFLEMSDNRSMAAVRPAMIVAHRQIEMTCNRNGAARWRVNERLEPSC